MAAFDSIIVTGDWISEHYLTSDAKGSFKNAVKSRVKEWGTWASVDSPSARFSENRQRLVAALAATLEDPDNALRYDEYCTLLRDVLGLRPGRGIAVQSTGSLDLISRAGSVPSLAVITARPAETPEDAVNRAVGNLEQVTFLRPDDDAEGYNNAARLLSAVFIEQEMVDFALIIAGRWVVVAERERWAQGRFLAVNLQAVLERNDSKVAGEVDTALAILVADSLLPDSEGSPWWARQLEESVKHTVGVSKDLRDGVRESIEIIASEVVRRRKARGLPPLPAEDAQLLARQSLRYLYRILFLLFAEASPELEVLPVGAPEYERGYSLDRLRDLVQVEMSTQAERDGTHMYQSLAVLFDLVDTGYTPADEGALRFNALRADLFRPDAIDRISEVSLGNEALQQVLARLLLSRESRGKDRGFISYAELGINQLGAVYEGLMSYTGFFAETALYEVARNGDPSKGSWVVPADQIEAISPKDFVKKKNPITGADELVIHAPGSFVFRLAGRERQQSASYYTPEVLTRFTVSQALEELISPEMSAQQILNLTVCEPALGSGAFAIEAVRQLAEQYLKRRQAEIGKDIDPDSYAIELQRAKAYIALHNVYGVDLNATAVELAEISLWLDTMVAGLDAPWFGLHLRSGNSLIGARHAVYPTRLLQKRQWLKEPPTEKPLPNPDARNGSSELGGGIFHFLLPADGWGAASKAETAKELEPERSKELAAWARSIKTQPTKKESAALQGLSERAERLWQFAIRRLQIAEQQSRRNIDVWGNDQEESSQSVQREQIEQALSDPEGPYQRLRLVMDAWCAMWFWPLTDDLTTVPTSQGDLRVNPPSLSQWIDALGDILGRPENAANAWQTSLSANATWDELAEAEQTDLGLATAQSIERIFEKHPWLRVTQRVAERQRFFHWQLDFATVFSNGGFDLQVGNPPWVRPRGDEDALLAEGNPWWQLVDKAPQDIRKAMKERTLSQPGIRDLVITEMAAVVCQAAFMGAPSEYPHLVRLQPDTYRCFMEQTWRHASPVGIISLIHPESHFTDDKAGLLRQATYQRLRRHWQFINEKQLFEEVHHLVSYGVHVYGPRQESPQFLQSVSLYVPETVEQSFLHDGSGREPGLKDLEGNWDTRPHRSRIINVDRNVLDLWNSLGDGEGRTLETRMAYTVNDSLQEVLERLADSPRVKQSGLRFSRGWDESIDKKRGVFDVGWGRPESWDDVILQGPHLHVQDPAYKYPNQTMKHNQDWHSVDLETLPADEIPVTAYKRAIDRAAYDAQYTDWGKDGESDPARDHYRVAWRAMAANTGERTLIPAIIPPGAAHVNGVFSFGGVDDATLVEVTGAMGSLVSDLMVRTSPKSGIYPGSVERLPLVTDHPLSGELRLRVLRLNCLTEAYADLWEETWSEEYRSSAWVGGRDRPNRSPLGGVLPVWGVGSPLRLAEDRRQALVEIDALVAVMLGITADELATVYRTAFPVLYGYDTKRDHYDMNGRLVPGEVLKAWQKDGDNVDPTDLVAENAQGNVYEYVPPFVTLDREADLRQAHAAFSAMMEDR